MACNLQPITCNNNELAKQPDQNPGMGRYHQQ